MFAHHPRPCIQYSKTTCVRKPLEECSVQSSTAQALVIASTKRILICTVVKNQKGLVPFHLVEVEGLHVAIGLLPVLCQQGGQHQGVFDGHAGPLPVVGSCRMAGVAQEGDVAATPSSAPIRKTIVDEAGHNRGNGHRTQQGKNKPQINVNLYWFPSRCSHTWPRSNIPSLYACRSFTQYVLGHTPHPSLQQYTMKRGLPERSNNGSRQQRRDANKILPTHHPALKCSWF